MPGLDTISVDEKGGLLHRRDGHAGDACRAPHGATALPCACATQWAASASPQIRNVATLGGNLLQRPRCWYFRAAEFQLPAKGGGHCFAIDGENQYHAIFDNPSCAIVHPSTAATVLVALGARSS